MLFKRNKYRNWYISIIKSAKSQKRERGNDYYEQHHIIPKALGGHDCNINLVLLTAREHFVCHWLLTKLVISKRHYFAMENALIAFCRRNPNHKRILSSREYERVRIAARIVFSQPKSESCKQKLRKPKTEEWKESIGEGLGKFWSQVDDEFKKQWGEKRKEHLAKYSNTPENRIKNSIGNSGANNAMFGRHHTEESKQAMSEKRKGINPSDEARRKMSETQKIRWERIKQNG